MAYLPISVNAIFDRFGNEYNVSSVVTTSITLDQDAYASYSPLYFPATYVTIYSLAFALATSCIVHAALYYGPTMWKTVKNIQTAQTDIHAKLMMAYSEVPSWWYLVTFACCLGMAIAAVEVGANALNLNCYYAKGVRWQAYDTGTSAWGTLLALVISAIYVLPGGSIFALSNQAVRYSNLDYYSR